MQRPRFRFRTKILLLVSIPLVVTAFLAGLFLRAEDLSRRAVRSSKESTLRAETVHRLEESAEQYVYRVLHGAPATVERSERSVREELAESERVLGPGATEAQRAFLAQVDALLAQGAGIAAGADSPEDRDAFIRSWDEEIHPAAWAVQDDLEAKSRAALAGAVRVHENLAADALAAAAVALAASLAVSFAIGRQLTCSVESVAGVARRVSSGDLDVAPPVTTTDEIGELAKVFGEMVEALRRQRKNQLGFLAAVAHDLRNPLAAMRTATDGLALTPDLLSSDRLRRTIDLVVRQIDRLVRLAEDLLDAARVEAGEFGLRKEPCDLSALVREEAALLASASPAHRLEVSTPGEPVVAVCDATRVGQVLDNLLQNAIRYSPGGGRIAVDLRRSDGDAIIAVVDQGVGIPRDQQPRIFEPFRREPPSPGIVPGVGLGLSIARRIVVAHGGSIDVESEPGKGSTFRVRLPASRPRVSH